jgi:tetratricopeptide (TPR) repeat protein
MWLIPVVFFLLLEGVLRLVGYGASYPLFEPVPDHPDYLAPSSAVANRYFVRQNAPTIPFDAFRSTKTDSTFRLFVQGGSSAAGFPYYYGASFQDILEARLQQTFPDREVEVVGTAMAAVNSYTLLDLADEIVAQDPDAVLLYAGHNEFYGALGVGSSESIGQLRPVVNLYLQLRDLRLVQGLRDVLSGVVGLFAAGAEGDAPSGTLMQRMVGEQSIAYRSPTWELGLRQFEGNLNDLLAHYRKHDVPVFVGTLASNERDQRPFASGLAPETDAEAWRAQFQQALAAAAEGDTARALTALDATLQRDSLAANAFYAQARLLDEQGQYAEARPAYLAAKDRDQLPFRAPEVFNRVIRATAQRHGATVVDVQDALADAAPRGIIGGTLMLEHLHPTIEGYFWIADAFYDALQRSALLGDGSRVVPDSVARRQSVLVTAVDSVAGAFRIQKLKAGWPFQPPGVVDEELFTLEAETPEEELALAYYEGDLSWGRAMEGLRGHYQQTGDREAALRTAQAVIQRYPFLDRPYIAAGDLLVEMQRYDEALSYYRGALRRGESAAARRMMGTVLLQQGQRQAAIRHLERARDLDPRNAQTLYNLAGAYALTNQFDRARTTVTRLLEIAPNHQAGRQLLASLPLGQ